MQRYRPGRVLAYCRVSSAEQGERGTSLDGQREEIERHCAAQGYPPPKLYVEVEGGGAEKIERRVELQRLMRDVRDGDLVICSKQDRWSRHTRYYLESTEQILARGARFFSIAERFDPSTPEGQFAASIMASVAELEHKRIRDRTVGTRLRLRKQGKYVEGRPPMGYSFARPSRVLTPNDDAKIVRRIFALCIEGSSTREISEKIRREHPTAKGVDAPAIARKLRSRLYVGEMMPVGGARKPANDAWIKSHEPIIDEATFRAAQRALETRRWPGRPAEKKSGSADFLLRGLLRCGACGYVMRSHNPGDDVSVKHGGWYLCSSSHKNPRRCQRGPHIRHDEVDSEVSRLMLVRLNALSTELAKDWTPPKKSDRPDFDGKRLMLIAKRKRVVDRIASGLLTDDDAKATLADIAEGLSKVERERDAYEDDAQEEMTPARRRGWLREVRAIAKSWAFMKLAARRRVIEIHAKAIRIFTDDRARWQRNGGWRVEVEWRLL